MNRCSWARSFADYFTPSAFFGQMKEVAYSKKWQDQNPSVLAAKSPSVLKNAKEISELARTAPAGAIVVWGVCGTHIPSGPKGCNSLEGIGHIGLTGINGYNFGNYSNILPDGPCERERLAGIYIPVLKSGEVSSITCSDTPEEASKTGVIAK